MFGKCDRSRIEKQQAHMTSTMYEPESKGVFRDRVNSLDLCLGYF